MEEIHDALWSCSSGKASGPDEFNLYFIKKMWRTIRHDLVDLISLFFNSGIMPKGINSLFISLIPKKSSGSFLKDFRPISLVNAFYKIITKILSNRFKPLLHKLINPCQCAFIKRCQILDCVLVANEAIHYLKTTNQARVLLKSFPTALGHSFTNSSAPLNVLLSKDAKSLIAFLSPMKLYATPRQPIRPEYC